MTNVIFENNKKKIDRKKLTKDNIVKTHSQIV